ncbi:MAG: ribokinase [Candidatus Marinimicrobia bacterium]|nr:ribokinase [Candidatus Neomarinimicrobiota bacterium]
MRKNKVIVVGSYNLDMTLTTAEFPKPGETVIGKNLTYGHGGKGANQAVAAARSGAQVHFLAKVGRDLNGEQAIASLTVEGIETQSIQRAINTPTGMAVITVNDQGENSIIVVSGANSTLSAAEVEHESQIFAGADVMLTQLETSMESVSAAITCAQKHAVCIILNPAPAKVLPQEILSKINIITPNVGEAEILTGISIKDEASLSQAANKLHAFGIEIVMITLGARGVYLSNQGESKLFPAIEVETIDTVGAGDVFNGVLAAHYSGSASLDEVVTLAVVAAGLSVTKPGAQSGIPDLADIHTFQRNQAVPINDH